MLLPTLKLDTGHVIKRALLKFVNGRWSTRDGGPLRPDRAPVLGLATGRALQRWSEKAPVETIVPREGEDLPDLDELNAKIPREEWELGLDGNPRPPWQKQYIAYFLDITDASILTFANSTIGSRLAVQALEDRISWMRALRGENVLPLVRLTDAALKTKFGEKRRPEFEIAGWRQFTSGALRVVDPKGAARLEEVKPLSLADEMADEVAY